MIATTRFLCGLLTALPCLLAAAGAAASADIYGYTDEAGVTHLSNVAADGPYRLLLRSPEDYRLRAKGAYRLASQAPEPSFAGLPYAEEIGAAARTFDLEPALLHAVITVESNYNPAALSPRGAVGLMQLMPDTARRYGIADPYRAESNIRGGSRYLRDLLALFGGDVKLALAAYNAGENAVIRHGRRIPPYPETRDYVPRVLKMYDALRLGYSE
ncbi:MAG TPA: lytic transglycosylase domain-containing protein [Rhodocyclaceae bacterium]|nr:lytic transglycosylase domain-containing protein [Rhodocyclaceae bacterium]